MSVEEIKKEIAELSDKDRQKVLSFLAQLESEEDAGYWARVRRRLADEKRENWIDAEKLSVSG
ncbi:MAG: hypothetical protein AAGA58_10655 [Verrucomicrobiota bacterium]